MTTRLLALALAAAGLSAGGFQLGSQQTPAVPPEPVLDRLPAGHALTVALQEPTSRVSVAERERLRKLAQEMEVQRKVLESQRVKALDRHIRRLEQKLVAQQALLASRDKGANSKTNLKLSPAQVKDVETQLQTVRGKLVAVERQRAQSIVEKKYDRLTLEVLRPEVRGRVLAEARALRVEDAERGFALLIALRERNALKLTPKQVTQLQLLQAEFIRRFAPLREEAETQATIEVVGRMEKDGPETELKLVDVKVGELVLEGTQVEFKDVPVLKEIPVVGKMFRVETEAKPIMIRAIVRSSEEDVAKRIEKLKNEIDDKAYEILNDEQQKRLRRLVAVSLSGPQP